MSRRRKWLFRLLAATLVPAVLFAAVEGGLRFCGYGYPTSFFLKVDGRDSLTTNRQFGWQFFPAAIARAPEVCELPIRKADGAYRIFVLGESAAMGTPQPAFGLTRMLQALLEQQYPGVRFEVVDAAMTAINSHVILEIARECGQRQPDLFVVYAGNNEVIGPYGPGTVLAAYSPSLRMIRAGIWAKSLRIGQLLQNSFAGKNAAGPNQGEWRGLEMFLDRTVAADDPRLESTYANFEANLTAICRAARSAGAKVVLSTVAVNLKDCAPFASLHRPDLDPSQLRAWEALYQSGIDFAAHGRHADAIAAWRQAAAIDDRFADLRFRLAQSLLTTGNATEARKSFESARDLDALRFRADTRINRIIRDVAASEANDGVYLVDAERSLSASENAIQGTAGGAGIPGRELFYEHVHFNPQGTYAVAATIFKQVAALLPETIRSRSASTTDCASFEQCRKWIALSDWDRYQMAADMAEMIARPPFTNQLDHAEQLATRRTELARLRAESTGPTALATAEEWYQSALERRGDDLDLRQCFARLLGARRKYDDSIAQWKWLLDRFPRMANWQVELGDVYDARGDGERAIAAYQEAARINPLILPLMHLSIGNVRLRENRPPEAEAEYRKAIAGNPSMAKAYNGLGVALREQKKSPQAIECFRKAVEIDPTSASAHANLADILQATGNPTDAIGEYLLATDNDPTELDYYHHLASILLRQGRSEAAIEQYRRMVRSLPASAMAHFRLASLLDQTHHFPEAETEYSAALKIEPDNLMAGHNLGGLFEKTDRRAEAIEQYRRVLKFHPDFAPARKSLARLDNGAE